MSNKEAKTVQCVMLHMTNLGAAEVYKPSLSVSKIANAKFRAESPKELGKLIAENKPGSISAAGTLYTPGQINGKLCEELYSQLSEHVEV